MIMLTKVLLKPRQLYLFQLLHLKDTEHLHIMQFAMV